MIKISQFSNFTLTITNFYGFANPVNKCAIKIDENAQQLNETCLSQISS